VSEWVEREVERDACVTCVHYFIFSRVLNSS
jgi:hypothetical protein